MEKTEALVSIVMPMYNQQDYIVRCLASVQKQSLQNIEIIVVNDGSTDDSLSIVKKMAAKDGRVQIVDKPNTGYGNSVNIGISKASGKYIGIVETDDFVSPAMFETLYNLSEDGTVDVIKGNFYNFYENNGKEDYFANDERRDMPDVAESFTIRQYPQILWGHPSVWSGIYRREFLKENDIKFEEVKGGGWVDNPFFFETLCKASKVKWTKEPLYYYRKTNMSSSSNGIVNPDLPFDRMNDNLDVVEGTKYTDDVTLKYLYSRALMYTTGALKECGYETNYKLIDTKAKNLLQRCDVRIFEKYFNTRDMYNYYSFASPIKTINDSFPKILIYNWLPYDNPQKLGGGVTIYCQNLIKTMLKKYPFAQIYFLSSGWAYSAERIETYVRRIGSAYGDRCKQYEVVNSPVPAAVDTLFVNPLVALENPELKATIKQFIDENGPFAAIHFNNIEGLSFDVLDLKEDYPDTRFVYSIHNYVPMCLTGFYYQRHNHCNCNPGHTALDCMQCTRVAIKEDIADEIYERGSFNVPEEKRCSKKFWTKKFGFDRLDEDVSEKEVLKFSRAATEKINKNCDSILAVSKRVYDIAVQNGFDAEKTKVSYIGTAIAERQVGKSLYKPENGLKIVFLGNSISYEEKGYPFLLDALSELEKKYASRIDLVLTVREREHGEIYQMLKKFRSVKVINGYTHEDLPKIFEGCNLSLVPVLWEDNLPQIAIESVAFGVPVLASDCGGASELCSDGMFKFRGGDKEDLIAKIKHFVDNPQDLEKYWAGHNGLTTMSMHLEDILGYYGLPQNPEPVQVGLQDYAYLLMQNEFLCEHMDFNGASRGELQREIDNLRKENDNLRQESEGYKAKLAKLDKVCPPDSFRRKVTKKLFKF
ncbi:MAG: glycosyltransferase [Clostridia bacterium]|nr:glycosyltransferase [Clostridia bacterium]